MSRRSEFEEAFAGVDLLARALVHVRMAFSFEMAREEAAANLGAREILLSCERQALDELEARFLGAPRVSA